MDKAYSLNGKHYFYGYGANHTLHITTVVIDGKHVQLTLYDKVYQGELHFLYGDIVICSELGFMKFKTKDKDKVIKTISFISDQHHGNGESVILFGLLSRYLLEEEERESIFTALIDQEASPYGKASFKESPSIHEVLKPLLFKYEALTHSPKICDTIR